MVKHVVLAAVILFVPLSGCVDALLGGGADGGDISRTIRLELDDSSVAAAERAASPEEAFQEFVETYFTYTHAGAGLTTADTMVRFIDVEGTEVERRLSDFTGLDTLSEGDRVTISGAAPYSGLVISDGGTIAERSGHDVDWFTAGGMPMPWAVETGTDAAWQVASEASQRVSMDNLHIVSHDEYEEYRCQQADGSDGNTTNRCGWETSTQSFEIDVDDLSYEYGAELDGEIGVTSRGDGAGDRIDVDLSGDFDLYALLDGLMHLQYTMEGEEPQQESFPFGLDASIGAEGDGLVRMRFDEAGEIRAVGGQGSFSTHGSVVMWDMNHTRDDPMVLADGDDFPSESTDYEEEPLDEPHDVDEEASALVRSVYGMDLAPGDRFEVVVDISEDELAIDLELTVVVAARETVDVAAGSIDSLRIESSLRLEVDPGVSSPQSIEVQDLTHWVHATSYVPVLMEGDASDLLGEGDLEELLQDVVDAVNEYDGDVQIDLPGDFQLENSFTGRLELTRLDGEVRVPALASVMAMWSPMGSIASSMVFVMVSDLGSEADRYEEYDEPYGQSYDQDDPDLSLVTDHEANELRVVASSSDADWFDVIIDMEGDCDAVLHHGGDATPVSGQYVADTWTDISAGDRITFNGSGACSVELTWDYTYNAIGSWTFQL